MGALPFTNGQFSLDQEQIGKVKAWLEEHAKTCPHLGQQTAGWFGSPLSYNFRPHGCGEGVEVVCNCGAKLDVSWVD